MRSTKTNSTALALIAGLFLIGCNEPATTISEKKDIDTATVLANNDDSQMPAYDPTMDPYLTGGEAVQKIKDTLGIKMYIATLKPGDSAMLHSHPDHTVYILEGGKLAVTFKGMGRMIMDVKAGDAIVNGPLSDAAKNVGTTNIKMLCHDIYRPRAK